jgi:hypothetical protein
MIFTGLVPTGSEHPSNSLENQQVSQKGGAETGAIDPQSGTFPTDLAELNAAWPTLPEPIRAGILAMIRGEKK